MIKVSEEKEESSWFDVLGTLKKFHPVAFVLLLALMWISITVYNFDISLQEKIVPFAFSVSLYFMGASFEFYRIDKQKE